jgi:NAD(P)H-dependent FMN reductase
VTPPSTSASVIQVVGIVGSLRRGSYNRAVLRAAASLAPASMAIVELPLAGVPLYDGDVGGGR